MDLTDGEGFPIPGRLDGPQWSEEVYDTGEYGHFELTMIEISHRIDQSRSTQTLESPRKRIYPDENNRSNRGFHRWMDHQYIESVEGRTVYVCHPYELVGDSIRTLALLEEYGYKVTISGRSAYYPGATVRIAIEAPEGHPFPVEKGAETTWLYRMYDKQDQLLYIGISKSAFARFEQRSHQKPWVDEVVRWTREKYPNRADALAAEREAIKSEHPIHNIQHSKCPA